MGTGPVDAFSLVLPRGRPDQAAPTVVALQRASVACRWAVQALDAGPGMAPGWGGSAADAYRHRRAVLARRCAELDQLTATAAGLVARWSAQAVADRSVMIRAQAAVEDLTRAELSAASLGQFYRPDLTAAHDTAQAAWTGARDDYQAGVSRLAQQLVAVRDAVTDRPLSLAEQAEAFVTTVWDDGAVAPAEQVWSLTGQALVDPSGWWETVRSVPGQARDLAGQVFHDPLGVLSDLVDAPAWTDGHLGEGLGTAAVLFVPGPRWMGRGSQVSGRRVIRTLRRGARGLPTVPTIDEMLDQVKLDLHEHDTLGHALAKHIDVTDNYLMDRLRYGTLSPDGSRGAVVENASRFTDRATAEAAITEALRAKEDQLRAFAANPGSTSPVIRLDCGRDIGWVYSRSGTGFRRADGHVVSAVLGMSTEGKVYIKTGYVE